MKVCLKKTIAKASFAVLALMAASTASADIIIEQSYQGSGVSFPSSSVVPAGAPAIVDGFTLTSNTDITSIDFWTFTLPQQDFFSDSISLAIYQDVPNVVFNSPVWASGPGLGLAANITSAMQGPDLYLHSLDIMGLNLNAGNYLLHIGGAQGNGLPPLQPPIPVMPGMPPLPGAPIAWAVSAFAPSANPSSNQFNPNGIGLAPPNQSSLDVDLAFRIQGTVNNVSAPATFALISLSIAGLLARRKLAY